MAVSQTLRTDEGESGKGTGRGEIKQQETLKIDNWQRRPSRELKWPHSPCEFLPVMSFQKKRKGVKSDEKE